MTHFFGQVWVWSLLAFLVGALITWLLFVRPARKRLQELEELADSMMESEESAESADKWADDDHQSSEQRQPAAQSYGRRRPYTEVAEHDPLVTAAAPSTDHRSTRSTRSEREEWSDQELHDLAAGTTRAARLDDDRDPLQRARAFDGPFGSPASAENVGAGNTGTEKFGGERASTEMLGRERANTEMLGRGQETALNRPLPTDRGAQQPRARAPFAEPTAMVARPRPDAFPQDGGEFRAEPGGRSRGLAEVEPPVGRNPAERASAEAHPSFGGASAGEKTALHPRVGRPGPKPSAPPELNSPEAGRADFSALGQRGHRMPPGERPPFPFGPETNAVPPAPNAVPGAIGQRKPPSGHRQELQAPPYVPAGPFDTESDVERTGPVDVDAIKQAAAAIKGDRPIDLSPRSVVEQSPSDRATGNHAVAADATEARPAVSSSTEEFPRLHAEPASTHGPASDPVTSMLGSASDPVTSIFGIASDRSKPAHGTVSHPSERVAQPPIHPTPSAGQEAPQPSGSQLDRFGLPRRVPGRAAKAMNTQLGQPLEDHGQTAGAQEPSGHSETPLAAPNAEHVNRGVTDPPEHVAPEAAAHEPLPAPYGSEAVVSAQTRESGQRNPFEGLATEAASVTPESNSASVDQHGPSQSWDHHTQQRDEEQAAAEQPSVARHDDLADLAGQHSEAQEVAPELPVGSLAEVLGASDQDGQKEEHAVEGVTEQSPVERSTGPDSAEPRGGLTSSESGGDQASNARVGANMGLPQAVPGPVESAQAGRVEVGDRPFDSAGTPEPVVTAQPPQSPVEPPRGVAEPPHAGTNSAMRPENRFLEPPTTRRALDDVEPPTTRRSRDQIEQSPYDQPENNQEGAGPGGQRTRSLFEPVVEAQPLGDDGPAFPPQGQPRPASRPPMGPGPNGGGPRGGMPPNRVPTGGDPQYAAPPPLRPRPMDQQPGIRPPRPAPRTGAAASRQGGGAMSGLDTGNGNNAGRSRPEPRAEFLPAKADGSSPSPEFEVKANAESLQYHTADSPYFGAVTADVWFRNAEEAEKAGFRSWNHRPNG